MMNEIVVDVVERNERGSSAAGRLRREGQVPGIVYGLGLAAFPVAVSARRIEQVLALESGRNTIFTLALPGQTQSRAVMIRDLQRDPVTERLVHVDFVRVDLARSVRVDVPVRLLGVPEGVKTQGGILEFVLRHVEVECLPTAIPEHFDVDVSGLALNQNLSVGDIPAIEGVKILDDPESILCVVAPPKAEAEPVVAEEAAPAAAEPEVIRKGKESAEAAPEEKDKDKEKEKK